MTLLDRPLRVLSIANSLVYGGDENRLLSLATYVDRARVEHHVAVLKRPDPDIDARYGTLRPEFAARGIDIIEIGEPRLDRGADSSMLRKLDRTAASLWRSVRKTVDLVKTLKIDVIDGHVGSGNRVAVAAGLLTGTPVVVTTYFAEFFKPAWLSYPSENLVLRGAHTIVTDSIERAGAIERFLGPRKPRIALIANGVRPVLPTRPQAEIRAALGIPDDPNTIVVGQIAGLVESKGWHVLLEAARIALAENPNFYFLCVGKERQEPGFPALLRARAEELGIAGRVRIGGYDGAIGDVWQVLDIHAHASLFDSLPNAIIEGMSVGKPAVVTSVGDVATLIADGETGFVVAPGDAPALAKRLVELGRDRGLRERMGAATRARYEARYRPEIMAQALENLFIAIATERLRERPRPRAAAAARR
jgi:glycosyltransferase involved in cell wall biosynthesis